MADLKINDLPALITQATTDVYEMSNNAATLSSKETRAQQTNYFNANLQLASTAQVTGLDADLANLQSEIDAIDLETVYTQGDGTITVIQNKPVTLKKDTLSEGAGFLLPSFTNAEILALTTFNNSEMVWSNDDDRVVVNANTDIDRRNERVAYLSDINSIISDAACGGMYFVGNSTDTTFSGSATPVKVAGTYISGSVLKHFTQSSGTLTYTDTVTRPFQIMASVTSTYNGSSNNTKFLLYLNGSEIAADTKTIFIGGVTPALINTTLISLPVNLTTDDALELWVQNDDGTDSLLVQELTYSVISIGGVSSGSDITLAGEDYLDLTGTVLTAYPVDLATTNVTGKLPFSNIADVTGTRLLGRYDSSTGTVEEIQLGTNLSFTGSTLNAADATATLQSAYTAGNVIVMQPNTPMDYSITSENVMLESWFYNNNNPATIPALIQIRKFKATDASNLTFTGITQRAIMVSKTSSASTYAYVDALYEGSLSDVQYDYRSINSLRKQNEFYRSILLQPGADNSTAGTCDTSSIFDVLSTTKGTRPIPMMTTTQVNAISSPADALLAYDKTLHVYKYYNSSAWKSLATTTSGPALETIGVMLLGTSSYTSTVQSSVISTMNGTKTIPANSLAIGQSIELVVIGLKSGVVSGGSGVITCKFGPLTFDSVSASGTASGSGSVRSWNVTFKVTRVASSSISISAAGFYEDDSHVVQSLRLYSTPAVQTGFDFTVDNDIDLLYTMTASGGNAFNFVAVNLTISKYN